MLPVHLKVAHRRNDSEEGSNADDDCPQSSAALLPPPRLSDGTSNERHLKHFETPPSPRNSHHRIPLGLTGVLCESLLLEIPGRGKMHYAAFRPRQLRDRPPLICLPGGPLLPSNYLNPLVHLIVDRAIVFVDALGAGQSKLGSGLEPVDLPCMVEDLHHLIQHLSLSHGFHLYGHSFGGILAYEYLKKHSGDTQCHAVVLSNAPSSVKETQARCSQLMSNIRQTLPPDTEDEMTEVHRIFASKYECRCQPTPLQLQQSLRMAGFQLSVHGLESIKDYEATPPMDMTILPPALILQGQHDFVDATPWLEKSLFTNPTLVTLESCAHYGLLEDEERYKAILLDFLPLHDPPLPDLILPNGVRVRR